VAAAKADAREHGTSLPAARQPLGLWVEVVRQFHRRRTKIGLGLVVVVPVLLSLAFSIGHGPHGDGGRPDGDIAGLATLNAFNFTLFSLMTATSLLLVVVVALFNGDTVASEANWGSLRYLLAMPVPRSRLLRQKLLVGLLYSLLASIVLPLVALGMGALLFGWHGIHTPAGQVLPISESLQAIIACAAYITFTMLLVASAAFMLSTLTDSPLGAVGGAVGIVIISNIFNQVTALGTSRDLLPTHYLYSWIDLLLTPAVYTNVYRGLLTTVVYSALFLAIGWWRFLRKDITS
jgi:ABC-2 type transport system permease protein